jgi:Leucine-rich repeat (LRR) protein
MNNNLLESVPEITDLSKLERVILNDNPLKVVPQFSHPPVELGIIRPTPYFTSGTVIIKRMREELAVEATTSLARLYQAIICSKDEMFSSIVDTLSETDYERLCKMMVLCNGTSSVKKRNRNGIPKVSATNSQLRVLPKVGPHVFDLAVTRVIIEKYKELDPVIKKNVEDRIYMLAKTSLLEDFYKLSEKDQWEVRSQFAQSNLTRLANALAEEEEGSIKN